MSLGGLVSSALLDFFVRPALFWLIGLKEAERVVNESQTEVALVEESDEERCDDESTHASSGTAEPTEPVTAPATQ